MTCIASSAAGCGSASPGSPSSAEPLSRLFRMGGQGQDGEARRHADRVLTSAKSQRIGEGSMADVKLSDHLTGGQVTVDAWDLCLDSADRRSNATEFRRTMVHDYEDGITFNWDNDYPGGLTFNGVGRFNGPVELRQKATISAIPFGATDAKTYEIGQSLATFEIMLTAAGLRLDKVQGACAAFELQIAALALKLEPLAKAFGPIDATPNPATPPNVAERVTALEKLVKTLQQKVTALGAAGSTPAIS